MSSYSSIAERQYSSSLRTASTGRHPPAAPSANRRWGRLRTAATTRTAARRREQRWCPLPHPSAPRLSERPLALLHEKALPLLADALTAFELPVLRRSLVVPVDDEHCQREAGDASHYHCHAYHTLIPLRAPLTGPSAPVAGRGSPRCGAVATTRTSSSTGARTGGPATPC